MEQVQRPPVIPRATYRLQFHKGFGFADAAKLVPYLAALGVSHVYASPFLLARPGSTHGYDITDHNRFNPEVGDEAAFNKLSDTLSAHGMGLILDFVPNHMGVGGADNPWWLDVLEWGRHSLFAGFFDIDWSPSEPTLQGKVLLPFLGDHYGRILTDGQLQLRFDAEWGSFSVWYWEHRFPIAVRDYPALLKAAREHLTGDTSPLANLGAEFGKVGLGHPAVREQAVIYRRAGELKGRLAALAAEQPAVREAIEAAVAGYNGTPGDEESFVRLHELLEAQHYRPAFWRVATAEINYRRFFDINDLAGLCMENQELFELAHRLIFRLIADNRLHGLRFDHIDGLYDPADYCRRLQDRAAYLLMQDQAAATVSGAQANALSPAKPRAHLLYTLVEKILARHERLRDDWPVDGTTGYDFMNLVNGLFVNPAAEKQITAIYNRFIGRTPDWEEICVRSKKQLVRGNLASEVNVLAGDLQTLAKQSRFTRDFTLPGITAALVEVVAQFPVYRTYIDEQGASEEDRRDLDWAFARARRYAPMGDTSVFDFLYAVLSTDLLREDSHEYRREEILRTAMKFQQVTGPVTAKSIEDTAFYRYYRLVSLNEVGGEPGHFGVSPAAFHRVNQQRLQHHPYGMLATATHDHKRGEDTRARIDAITEVHTEWRRRVRRWSVLNKRRKGTREEVVGPGRNDEYLIYQTLVGSWPLEIADPADPHLGEYADRIATYMNKAMRESKTHTSWNYPDQRYEQAVDGFVRAILDPARSAPFLNDLLQFVARIEAIGAVNGLAQTLLKLTAPGVPDLYQGTELWDQSLVDPDNRRPVDYALRRRWLKKLSQTTDVAGLVEGWRDGRIKQYLIARTLDLRRRLPGVFADGAYISLEVTGAQADRVVAFHRKHGPDEVVVVVPRLVGSLLGDTQVPLVPAGAWGGTAVTLPQLPVGAVFREVLTGGSRLPAPSWRVGDLLAAFPVALLSHCPRDEDPPALPPP